jgi:hypothetical protein
VASGGNANGRPFKYPREEFVQAVWEVPLHNRSTVWLLQGAVGVPKPAIHCLINQEKVLCPHTNAIKPILTDVKKMARLEFCLNKQGKNSLYNAILTGFMMIFDLNDWEILFGAG